MKRNPVVGDIIKINKIKGEHLVVYGQQHEICDLFENTVAYEYVIKTIDINDIGKPSAKEKGFFVSLVPCTNKKNCIMLDNITLLRHVKKVKVRKDRSYSVVE